MDVESSNKIKCLECQNSIGAQDMNNMGDFSPCNPNDSDKYTAQCPKCKHKFAVVIEFHCVASIGFAE